MNDIALKIPMVLKRTRSSGFRLTDALVAELRARGWSYINDLEQVRPDCWYVGHDKLADVRRDEVFLDVVRSFEAQVKELSDASGSWKDVAGLELALLDGLRAVEVTVRIDVEEEDAGLESVNVYGGLW